MNEWADRSANVLWRQVFTFFMEGFALYGASMHPTAAFPPEAALTAARRHRWSASRTPIEAEHEHGFYLLSDLLSENGKVVEADRVAANPWPDSFITRLEALALLQTLNADLLSHDSATLTLERWCETHHMASPARIVAERVKGADKQATAEQLQLLGESGSGAVRHRRVRLRCGAYILSEADNWYVPARLTDAMNWQLATTETSFGRAVQALNFRRRILSAKLLWRPLPEGWETGASVPDRSPAMLGIPDAVLEHRAVLTLPNGTPFSEVIETYTGNVLAFPPLSRP